MGLVQVMDPLYDFRALYYLSDKMNNNKARITQKQQYLEHRIREQTEKRDVCK